MGVWYAVEIVEHNIAVEPNTVSTLMNLCPLLQLTREDNMTIRLQWNENRKVWIYRFLEPKPETPGIWDTARYQDGENLPLQQHGSPVIFWPVKYSKRKVQRITATPITIFDWQTKRKKDPALFTARKK